MIKNLNTMGDASKSKFIKKAIIIYSVIYALFAGVMVLSVSFYGKSFIWFADAYSGIYPSFVYVGNYLRSIPLDIVKYHSIPIFDFSLGFGINVSYMFATLGDPFNWLSIFFPGRLSVIGYGISILVRVYCAGIGFVIWGGRKKLCNEAIVIGAVTYAFCGYILQFGIPFLNYLTAFTAFPFIVVGVDEVIDEKRKSLLLILGIALTSMNGINFIWIATLFFLFYILIRELVNECSGNRLLQVFTTYGRCFFHYVVGLGISAVFFIPFLVMHLESSRSGVSVLSIFRQFHFSEFVKLIGGFSVNNIYSGLSIGPLAFLCIIVFLLCRGKKDYKILTVVGIACYFILGYHVLMNCFAYSDYAVGRSNYTLYFLISVCVAYSINDMLSLSEHRSLKGMLPALSIYSCYVAFWMILSYRNGFQHKVLFFLFLILFVLAACLFFWAGKIRKSCRVMGAAFLCFVSFMACGYLGYYERLSEYFVDLDIYDEIKNSAYGRHSEEDQSRGALRTDIIDTKNMAALILGNPGTYSYFSIQNDSLYDFFRDMTCSCSIYGGNVQMRTLDGRRSLEMLMGVGTYSEDEDGTILHDNNDLRLPLGFTYDSYALNSDVAQLDPLSKSTAVLDTVYLDSVPDIDVPKVELEEIENNNSYEIVPVEISYPSSMTDEGIMAVDSYDIIDISLSKENMDLDESLEYYLYIESIETDRDWGTIDINQMKKMRFSSAGEASNEKGEYLARIPINDEIKKSGHITLGVSKGKYKFGTIEIRKVDTSDYAARREELINDSLEDIEFNPNNISGRITCENDKLLFVSLLFDKRWKCFVDGNSQKLLLADSGFTAIELTEGTHDVIFKYDCTLNILSAIVSLLSIIVVIAWMKKDVGK